MARPQNLNFKRQDADCTDFADPKNYNYTDLFFAGKKCGLHRSVCGAS